MFFIMFSSHISFKMTLIVLNLPIYRQPEFKWWVSCSHLPRDTTASYNLQLLSADICAFMEGRHYETRVNRRGRGGWGPCELLIPAPSLCSLSLLPSSCSLSAPLPPLCTIPYLPSWRDVTTRHGSIEEDEEDEDHVSSFTYHLHEIAWAMLKKWLLKWFYQGL